MLFNTSFFAIAALMATTALAAPAVNERSITSPIGDVSLDTRAVLIATDPTSACNCPNNCSHHVGSDCKYKAGTSTDGSTVEGKCIQADSPGGAIFCQPK